MGIHESGVCQLWNLLANAQLVRGDAPLPTFFAELAPSLGVPFGLYCQSGSGQFSRTGAFAGIPSCRGAFRQVIDVSEKCHQSSQKAKSAIAESEKG